MTDSHTILENRSWRLAAIWLSALVGVAAAIYLLRLFGIVVAIWLASVPVLHDFTDQKCADDPDRFAITEFATPATSAISPPPPCVQDNVSGDAHEVTPAPGIKIYIGPDGEPKIGTD